MIGMMVMRLNGRGLVYRTPGIWLTGEENIGKPQLGDRLMKTVRSVIASIGAPYIRMKSVGSECAPGREKEIKNEMMWNVKI